LEGAHTTHGTEDSWFVQYLLSSAGKIRHYETEVGKKNFGEVLASGDKNFMEGLQALERYVFVFRKHKT
jgi:hypothetical protein